MPSRLLSRLIVVGLTLGTFAPPARADHAPPTAALRNPDAPRRPFAPRGAAGGRAVGDSRGTGGWWLGTAGVALALAAFGAISLASRRFLPQGHTGPLRVVGRASLSPKQTVYLLQVGDRVLIVGAGQNGPPALLGELDDPGELERLLPRRGPAPPTPVTAPTVRIDHRIGEDA